MMRLRPSASALLALLGVVAASAASAEAKVVRHHLGHGRAHYAGAGIDAPRPASNFPVFVDHGSDYNPGSDNLYFSDTKTPRYIVGPAWFQRWE